MTGFRTIQVCSRCTHNADHACILLRHEVQAAVEEANGRAVRHSIKLPPAEVILDCQGFTRLGRSKA